MLPPGRQAANKRHDVSLAVPVLVHASSQPQAASHAAGRAGPPPRPPAAPWPPLLCSGSNDPLDTLPSLHAAPVTALRYNEAADTVISTDGKGVIEYWSAVS